VNIVQFVMPPKNVKTNKRKERSSFSIEYRRKRDGEGDQVKKQKLEKQDDLQDFLTEELWKKALQSEFEKDYFKKIEVFLSNEYSSGREVFPPKTMIFNALNLTPLNKVKVVLLGQDPYHDNGQAMGLAFSVPQGIKTPPSLKNMYKELTSDLPGFTTPSHGDLTAWGSQGVLLLNATLTVRAHEANSHSKCGWQTFTDAVISTVSSHCEGVVFLLWGNFAHKKEKLVDATKHSVLKFPHPSPLSYGKFKDCKCFSKVNEALESHGKKKIDWSL